MKAGKTGGNNCSQRRQNSSALRKPRSSAPFRADPCRRMRCRPSHITGRSLGMARTAPLSRSPPPAARSTRSQHYVINWTGLGLTEAQPQSHTTAGLPEEVVILRKLFADDRRNICACLLTRRTYRSVLLPANRNELIFVIYTL